MKIALVQTDIKWCNPQVNIAQVEKLLSTAEAADLYVLPEMWSTGFVIEAQDVAKSEEECDALKWMVATTAARNCAISGSLVILEDGKFYNRHYFVTPNGIAARYDKRHLFRLGGETKRFTSGKSRIIVEWQGVKFLLQTCYDIRFPIFSRNRLSEVGYDYDVAIYVASFPAARQTAWHTLSAARAIENEAFVVAVNRTGNDPYCHYSGGSVVWDSFGQVVGECDQDESVVVVQIDTDELNARRKRFPTLRDGDLYDIK